ncbi:DUF3298 and DUF4163 domain-containing protein [Halalkalibacter krulwichiae]|uniref:Peptidoglycan-N-acetylmuramic acid deacetylase PdaC n=1 Tax=Halalkalibacter krulwichiae TaxID=199441 RepID=A0A1X9MF67_9BACI|nr:DUF3298 and DUF4163 domain-containing protein [Halalkalibacter krulwichiae]ARK29092.1 hypothetical protein BkAM31D_04080 [Halalkalibacter krulwichiae]
MNISQLPADIISRHIVSNRLDVYYPQLHRLKDYTVQMMLNERIKKQVMTMMKKQGYKENPQTTITGGYEIKTNQRDIVSLTNSHYSYSGGAHGVTLLKSLTMNIKNGFVYSLKDLFKPSTDYKNRLNFLINEQIKERELPLIAPFEGVSSNQYYYISDKALIIYFQLYELLPYAWGFPYFVISVYDIQDLLIEDGALGRMVY